MQVLDRKPPAGIAVGRAFHAVLAVQLTENELPTVIACGLPKALAQFLRQTAVKPLDDAENFLRRGLVMRYLDRECSRPKNRPQKHAARHPGADAHLAGLQHNVLPPAILLVLQLYAIGQQRSKLAVFLPYFQQLRREQDTEIMRPANAVSVVMQAIAK
jgi:hypothetical protein